jgi:DNA-binding transcriptional MerR regulator
VAEGEGFAADAAGPVRRDGKSAAAYRTTGEVAAALDLPAHVLRFWEGKFPQVRPLKRAGGRRYYRPQDIALLCRIRQCLYQEGYTIRGVQQLLRGGVLRPEQPVPSLPDPPEAAIGPASCCRTSRETLEELRRDLVEIRALLGAMNLR